MLAAVLASAAIFSSCSEWTETQSVEIDIRQPWERNPELWEDYFESLRAYKQAEHFLVYARLENSPETLSNEKCFMRSLPDSLDIVSLTNAENFSAYDVEDMEWMRKVGTKVLYQVDFASHSSEFSDAAGLEAYLDQAIASVRKYGLDGWSFTGTVRIGDDRNAKLSSLMVKKLAEAKDEGQMLVFEGDPLFISSADLGKIDLFVLATEESETVNEVNSAVMYAVSVLKIPYDKILLAASVESTITDESLEDVPAVAEMTDKVVSYGPLAGLAVYDIEADYYNYEENYLMTRNAIQILNYSK